MADTTLSLDALRDHKVKRLIEFAIQHDEFTKEEICEAVGLRESELKDWHNKAVASHDHFRTAQVLRIHPDAFFSYLDFIELQEAKRHGTRAMIIAIVAMLLQVVGLGVQAALSWCA